MEDDSSDGMYPKEELGTISVRIHRVKVTGPWFGKLNPIAPTQVKPVLLGEKSVDSVPIDHRVGYATLTARLIAGSPLQPQ